MKVSLIITLLAVLAAGSACSQATAQTEQKEQTVHSVITSGRINTLGNFSFMYGRVEASIKMPPTANGLWPAFWLLGADYETVGWPACGEIDIVEMGGRGGINGKTQASFFNQGCHWGEILGDGSHPNYNIEYNYSGNLDDGFHRYRMEWDDQTIRMYLDDTAYFVMNTNALYGTYPVINYFNKPFYLLLNLAVGGNYPGIYSTNGITALNKGNGYTAAMYVDYVRVFDKDGNLAFEDNFDGSALDESKWNIEVNDLGGGNSELQSYRRENVLVGREPVTGNNCLIINAAEQ